jgi:hypothetical protein
MIALPEITQCTAVMFGSTSLTMSSATDAFIKQRCLD